VLLEPPLLTGDGAAQAELAQTAEMIRSGRRGDAVASCETGAAWAKGFRSYPRGIVAEAVHTLQEVTSPSSQVPLVPKINTGTAFPSTNETEK
jgi:hypothetical protein